MRNLAKSTGPITHCRRPCGSRRKEARQWLKHGRLEQQRLEQQRLREEHLEQQRMEQQHLEWRVRGVKIQLQHILRGSIHMHKERGDSTRGHTSSTVTGMHHTLRMQAVMVRRTPATISITLTRGRHLSKHRVVNIPSVPTRLTSCPVLTERMARRQEHTQEHWQVHRQLHRVQKHRGQLGGVQKHRGELGGVAAPMERV